ncbi:MAG: hypothetical protein JSW39_15370, partial [Desulfobacterales bacterium]
MKSYFWGGKHKIACRRFLFGAAVFLSFAIVAPVAGELAFGDEPITLDVKDEPLGDVLDRITEITGYKFIVGDEWKDTPVTAIFQNLPVHKGLKKILENLNHVIIYSAGGIIKINIYDEKAAIGKTSPDQTVVKPSGGQSSSRIGFEPATAPPSGSAAEDE